MTKFYYHLSPDPAKVALFFEDAGLPYELVPVDTRKGEQHLLGETYTIVDMAAWGWARAVPFILGAQAWSTLPNVKRLLDEINARPAAQRAEALKTPHAYKAEMDEDARKVLFPQNERLAPASAA